MGAGALAKWLTVGKSEWHPVFQEHLLKYGICHRQYPNPRQAGRKRSSHHQMGHWREELGCLGQCAQEPAVKVTNHRPFFLAYHPACFLVTICRMGDHVEPRHHSPSHCLCVSVLYCVTSTEIHSKSTSPGSCSHILKEVLIQHKYSVDD